MTRRRRVAAAAFFTLFGTLAFLPPLVLLFRFDARVMGVPVETVYVFVLWFLLVAGARLFGRVLPDEKHSADTPSEGQPRGPSDAWP